MLRRYGILTTAFAQSAASYPRQMNEAIKYLISNRALTLADDELRTLIMRSGSSFITPISELFSHLVDSFKMQGSLPFIEVFIQSQNPPEIFTTDSVCFDTREVMKDVPEKMAGPVVNLTNVIKQKNMGGRAEYVLDDIMKIHGLYVRSALCTSYLITPDKSWLTPRICSFIIESYNMIIINQLRVHYGITDVLVLKKVAFVVQSFMAQMLDAEEKIKAGVSELVLRSGNFTSMEIQNMISELNGGGFDFTKKYNSLDLCEMIKVVGGEKFQKLNFPALFRLFTAGSIDKIQDSIALEYPPFWVYRLLAISSGAKHPVYNNIFKNGNLLQKIKAFAHDLNTTDTFIHKLHGDDRA